MKGLRACGVFSFFLSLFFFLFQTPVYGADTFTLKIYGNTTLSGTPVQTSLEDSISVNPTTYSGPYSARWTGALTVPKSAIYQFQVGAHDGMRIVIDGKTVLSRWQVQNGWHAFTKYLTVGSHPIQIDYFQKNNGGYGYVHWRALHYATVADARSINGTIDNNPDTPTIPTDPTTPQTPVNVLPISFVGNPPRQSGGVINTRELNAIVSDLNLNSYVFFPQHTASQYPDDYVNSFNNVLSSVNAPIYLDLLGFNHKAVRPFYQDYVTWAKDAATKSITHQNLKGMILDDFYGATGSNTFSDSSYVKSIYDAATAQNSNFKLYATLYCTPDKADVTKFTHDASAQYIDGVYLYSHPSYTNGGVAQPEKMIDSCIATLKAAGKHVIEGIYLDDLENYSVTDTVFKKNIAVALKTHPDSFVLYETQSRQSSGAFDRYAYIRNSFVGN